MTDFKISTTEDGLITTTVHGMGINAYIVTEEKVNNFNTYSKDFQVYLTLFSIFFGVALGNINDIKSIGFIAFTILTVIMLYFLIINLLRFNKVKKNLFVKASNLTGDFYIISGNWGTESHNIDVTNKLNDRIRNGRLVLTASNEIDYDPHIGSVKRLKIKYHYKGADTEKICNEGEQINLP